MNTAKVSILITAFNRASFLSEAIQSVLNSSFSDFEIIIVDDGSIDNTLQVAQSWAATDSRIKVYRNQTNLGDYSNRNKAASFASGKYLKYVDSDDRIYPDTLERMVVVMDSFPSAGVGLCDVFSRKTKQNPDLLNAREAYLCHYFQKPIFFASPGQAIFRKSAFDAVGGFPEKRMVGDFEMWHKLVLSSPVVLMPGNLYWIRKHDGQEVAMQQKYILEYEKIKMHYLFSIDSPLSKKEAFTVIQKRKRTVFKIFIRKLISLKFTEAAVRLRVYWFYMKQSLLL